MTQRKAVIDIGSNSIKWIVGEKRDDGGVAVLADKQAVTRLGEGLVPGGNLAPAAFSRNVDAVEDFVRRSRALGCGEIVAVGTMALRSASDREAFRSAVRERTGIDVRVLAGEEEARLSFLAVSGGLEGPCTVFDSGGGSTEFIFGDGRTIVRRFSVNLGVVRLTETFGAEPADLGGMERAIERDLAALDAAPQRVVGIGGTVTSMAAVAARMAVYDPSAIEGMRLTAREVERQVALYHDLPVAGRMALPGLQKGRADVILAGSLIVRAILRHLHADQAVVSSRGLRHGVLDELFAKER